MVKFLNDQDWWHARQQGGRVTPCPAKNRYRRWWNRVPTPKVVSMLMTLIYLVAVMIGITTVIESSFRISDLWGRALELVWSWMLILGGLVGAMAAPTGAWFAERAAVVATGVAALMYFGGTMALHYHGTPGNQLMQAGWALFGALFLVTRWYRIQGAMLDPFREG